MRSALRGLLATGTLLLALAAPAPARAQVALPLNAWTQFQWFDGVGPVDDPFAGFFLSLLHPAVVQLTDAQATGDAFDLFVDGVLRLSTPAVPALLATGAGTGDQAWADPRLSKGSLALGPGTYLLEVHVRQDAGFGFGEGFIRAVIPEPTTPALLGPAFAALLGVAWRRRRAARA